MNSTRSVVIDRASVDHRHQTGRFRQNSQVVGLISNLTQGVLKLRWIRLSAISTRLLIPTVTFGEAGENHLASLRWQDALHFDGNLPADKRPSVIYYHHGSIV